MPDHRPVTGDPDANEPAVMATIAGAVLAVAVVGAGWIWRQARRRRASPG
jgi:uncharacterized membrane protein YccC